MTTTSATSETAKLILSDTSSLTLLHTTRPHQMVFHILAQYHPRR